MQRNIVIGSVGFAIILAMSLAACRSSKPTGSDYLGKWEGTIEALTGGDGPCHLDISKVGESFVIKSERQTIANCGFYEGIATLTPEGNLQRGSGIGEMVISFDKSKDQAVVSGGGKLRYLTRVGKVPESALATPTGGKGNVATPETIESGRTKEKDLAASKELQHQSVPVNGGGGAIEGTISKFECGDSCYLTITDRFGKAHTGLCLATICNAWTAEQAMPPIYKGKSLKATLGKGKQYDEEGNVMGTTDAFTKIQLQ